MEFRDRLRLCRENHSSEGWEAAIGFDSRANVLRSAAVKAEVIDAGQKTRFGFHNFRHSLASAYGEDESTSEDDPGIPATSACYDYTAAVLTVGYAIEAGSPKEGSWKSCLATEIRLSRSEFSDLSWVGPLGERISTKSRKCFEMWWPGTELNRRRQPFQCLTITHLQ